MTKIKRKEAVKQLKDLPVAQMSLKLKEINNKLLDALFDKNFRKLKDQTTLKKLRREKARIKTFIRQKDLESKDVKN